MDDNTNIYKYYFNNNTIHIYFPFEYYFPDFISTIENLQRANFYTKAENIILDLRECKSLHGIGMGTEIQEFYSSSKNENKNVCWLGNSDMYNILEMMTWSLEEEVIPYCASIE